MKKLIYLIACFAFGVFAGAAENDQIPSARKTVWTPNVQGGSGVIGGIAAKRALFTTTFRTSDYGESLEATIAASTDYSIILLSAQTYTRSPSGALGIPSRRILRGVLDGQGNRLSKIVTGGTANGFAIGSAGGYGLDYPDGGMKPITSTLTKGATTLTVADASPFVVNQMAVISWDNPTDDALLASGAHTFVLSPNGAQKVRKQIVMVTAVNTTTDTITFFPGIHHAPGTGLNAYLSQYLDKVEDVGIEDLEIDGIGGSMTYAIQAQQAFNCWFTNLRLRYTKNYFITLARSMNCEVRQCIMDSRNGTGTSGSGILLDGPVGNCLIEDNQIFRIAPSIEVNLASTGNVFGYNVLDEATSPINTLTTTMNVNHGGHNSHNVYEANVSTNFQSDGLHGSASEDTFYRNFFHGSAYGRTEKINMASLNRLTRNYSVVGNVFGTVDYPSASYPNFMSFGNPNIGNSYFELPGFSWLSTPSVPPTDWKMTATVTYRPTPWEVGVTLNSGKLRYRQGYPPGQFRSYSSAGENQILGVNTVGGGGTGVAGDTIYMSNQRVWMIYGTRNSSGTLISTWSVPQQLSSLGPDTEEHQLQAEWSADGSSWHYGWATGDVWLRTRADSGAYSSAVRIAGETTSGGNYTDYLFKLDINPGEYQTTPTGDAPGGWSDTPTQITSGFPTVGTTFSIAAGIAGYQDLDLDVERTTLLKANVAMFRPSGPGIIEGQEIGTDTLPASLYRDSKPDFFLSTDPWPPFGPENLSPNYTKIPAGRRFLAEIPPILNSAVLGSDGISLLLSFSKDVTVSTEGHAKWSVSFPGRSMTYYSGNGTSTITYRLSSQVTDLAVGTISYEYLLNGVQDSNNNDLEAITNRTIYNFSGYTGGAIWIGPTREQATGTRVFPGNGYVYVRAIVIPSSGSVTAVRSDISAFDSGDNVKMGLLNPSPGPGLTWMTWGVKAVSEAGNYLRIPVTEVRIDTPGTYYVGFTALSNNNPTLSVITGQPSNSMLADAKVTFDNVGPTGFSTDFGIAEVPIFGLLLVPDPVPNTNSPRPANGHMRRR